MEKGIVKTPFQVLLNTGTIKNLLQLFNKEGSKTSKIVALSRFNKTGLQHVSRSVEQGFLFWGAEGWCKGLCCQVCLADR